MYDTDTVVVIKSFFKQYAIINVMMRKTFTYTLILWYIILNGVGKRSALWGLSDLHYYCPASFTEDVSVLLADKCTSIIVLEIWKWWLSVIVYLTMGCFQVMGLWRVKAFGAGKFIHNSFRIRRLGFSGKVA